MTETAVRTIGGIVEIVGAGLIIGELVNVSRYLKTQKGVSFPRVLWDGLKRRARRLWGVISRKPPARTATGGMVAGGGKTSAVGTAEERDTAAAINAHVGDRIDALQRELLDVQLRLAEEVAARTKADTDLEGRLRQAIEDVSNRLEQLSGELEDRTQGLEKHLVGSLPLQWAGVVLILVGIAFATWSVEIARVL